jgi:hypothetical protein
LLNTPNDPYYSSAWYLQSVNAPAAWATTTGSSEITVANIDTGFALGHQDLVDHWKFNLAEYGGGKESDGIDNDNNGYVDDYRGWDFTSAGQGTIVLRQVQQTLPAQGHRTAQKPPA